MDFKTKMQLFRAFFNHHKHTEGNVESKHLSSVSLNKRGIVVITACEKTTAYNLSIVDVESNGMAIRTTDNEIIICFGEKAMEMFHQTHNGLNTLKSVVAHEAGHIINGDFDLENIGPDFVNVDKEVQENLFKIAMNTEDPKKNIQYLRSVVSAMLKGGCLEKELKADLSALRFISLENLIHIHSLGLKNVNEGNPYIALEKVNRINQLNAFAREHFKTIDDINEYQAGYALEIYLIDDSARPYDEVISELFEQGTEVIREYNDLMKSMTSEVPGEGWIRIPDKELYIHPDYYYKGYKFARDHGVDIREYIRI